MNFLTTLDGAMEFYKRCHEQGAVTLEARLKILKEMTERRQVFPQTNEQVEKRIANKRVLRIRKEPPNRA